MTIKINRRSLAFPVLLAGTILSLPGLAQQVPSKPGPVGSDARPATQSEAKRETAKPKKAGEEGIDVHGHWTIVVKNPDGTVAQKRDFENSLNAGTGETGLLALLAGQSTAGDLAIGVEGGADVCTTGANDTCLAVASATAGIGGQLCPAHPNLCSSGLTEAVSQAGVGSVTLAGQISVAETGVVSNVSTVLLLCTGAAGTYASVAPSACYTLAPGTPNITATTYTLTSATLGTPLNVTSGQTISIGVVLTFS
jgi:hypothetical protein